MGNTRVHQTIGAFNTYIRNTDVRLQAINPVTTQNYWKDYGLVIGDANDWHSREQAWVNTLFPAYSNPATSTSIAKADVQTFMNNFREFANPLLDKIEVSPIAGNAEEQIFNFHL